MGFLKGLGTGICSFLLFLALVVFSIAFLLNSTVLSADFVNSQVDKLDLSSIAHDIMEEQIDQELPRNAEFLNDVFFEVIADEEPLIKEQLHAGINDAYFYFLNEEGTLIITISVIEIKDSLKDNLWQASVDYLERQFNGLSGEALESYIRDIIRQLPEDILPAALESLPTAQRNEVIRQYLLELTGQMPEEDLPFGLDIIIKEQVRVYFESYFDDSINGMPDAFVIDEGSIGPEAMNTLRDVRNIIGYFKAGYIWLIVFMIVMTGLIFLINWRNVKASVRALGITLLIFGILDLAGVLTARNISLAKSIPDYSQIPVSIQGWVEGFIKDMTGVMLWFSIGVLVAGVILFVTSFFIGQWEAVE